jgi:sugar porter (SP) family MFS transporter
MESLRNVYTAFVFIASGGLLFGYIIGINGNVVTSGQLLCPDDWTGSVGSFTSYGYTQCWQLNALEKGFLSSLNLIGAVMSSLFCFGYADSLLGRKLEVQLAAVLFLSGASIAAASPVLWGVYIGFLVYGVGIGFAMHAAPVFIAEISPASVRGTLVSAKEAVVVLGIFLGFLMGFIFSGMDEVGWRYMVGAAGIFAVIQGIGISFVPQSPRYLVLRAVTSGGDSSSVMEAARASLQWFRSGTSHSVVEQELETMRGDIAESVGTQVAKWNDAFTYPLPLVIGCGLVFLQQITGQPSVLYFATNIFKSAGFGSSAALSSVGVGLVKLLATLFTVWRVDQYGRRFLLFVGISMMAVALALIGTAFCFRECETPGVTLDDCMDSDVGLPKSWAILTVVGLMVYVSGYQVGFGPIAWLMISEVFPLRVRGGAMSIAAVVNFGSNISMTLTQEVLQEALTPAGVFFGYLVMAIVSLVFVKAIVPETKGKTLEEIERMLTAKKAATLGPAGTISLRAGLVDDA